MPAFSPYCIELQFIRAADSDPSTDDILKIRKNYESGEFELVYTDSDKDQKVTHRLHSLYRQRILDHIYLLLKNMTLDEDNFHQLQLNLPAMPRLIVSVENLKDLYYRDHFLDLIGNSLDNLDVIESKTVHLKQDDSSDDELFDEEDEYADMPPLISPHQYSTRSRITEAQHLRNTLQAPMDRFLRNTAKASVAEQRRSSRLAERGSRFGPGADVSGTPRHMFFDDNNMAY